MKARRQVFAGIVFLSVALVALGCSERRATNTAAKAKQVAGKTVAETKVKENPGRVRDIQAGCAKTTEEGKEIIARTQAWMPIVNGNEGGKPLKDVAADFKQGGVYELCWAASQKSNGRWKVIYNYVDISGGFQEAEWEFDPTAKEMKPFNSNAMQFWTPKS
jgi:hypothetical protein